MLLISVKLIYNFGIKFLVRYSYCGGRDGVSRLLKIRLKPGITLSVFFIMNNKLVSTI